MEVGLYTTTPEVESSKTDGDKKKDKDKTDKKKKMQLLKKVKILQHQRNSILKKKLFLKIQVFKQKKIHQLVRKQLIGLPLLKANIE